MSRKINRGSSEVPASGSYARDRSGVEALDLGQFVGELLLAR